MPKFRPRDSPLGDRLWPPVKVLKKFGSRLPLPTLTAAPEDVYGSYRSNILLSKSSCACIDLVEPPRISLDKSAAGTDDALLLDIGSDPRKCGNVLYISG